MILCFYLMRVLLDLKKWIERQKESKFAFLDLIVCSVRILVFYFDVLGLSKEVKLLKIEIPEWIRIRELQSFLTRITKLFKKIRELQSFWPVELQSFYLPEVCAIFFWILNFEFFKKPKAFLKKPLKPKAFLKIPLKPKAFFKRQKKIIFWPSILKISCLKWFLLIFWA